MANDETTARILDAALSQVGDFGLRRLTMDDVARRVGMSRMTIYRYFPKKDQLVKAVLRGEMSRFLTKLDAVIDSQSTPTAKLAAGLDFCISYLRGHQVLERLLRTEPELVLPYLTTQAGPIVTDATAWIARHIRAEVAAGRVAMPEPDILMMSELLVRVTISLVLTRETAFPVDRADEKRRLTENYLRPFVAFLDPAAHTRDTT